MIIQYLIFEENLLKRLKTIITGYITDKIWGKNKIKKYWVHIYRMGQPKNSLEAFKLKQSIRKSIAKQQKILNNIKENIKELKRNGSEIKLKGAKKALKRAQGKKYRLNKKHKGLDKYFDSPNLTTVKQVFKTGNMIEVKYKAEFPVEATNETADYIEVLVSKWWEDIEKRSKNPHGKNNKMIRNAIIGNYNVIIKLQFCNNQGKCFQHTIQDISHTKRAINEVARRHHQSANGEWGYSTVWFNGAFFYISKLSQRGGCNKDRIKNKIHYLGGNLEMEYRKLSTPKTKNNNCGISLLLTDHKKITGKTLYANKIRKLYYTHNNALTPEELDKTAKAINHPGFCVENKYGKIIHTYGTGQLRLMLRSGHYYFSEIKKMTKCRKCGQIYLEKHDKQNCSIRNNFLNRQKDKKNIVSNSIPKKFKEGEKRLIYVDGEMFIQPFNNAKVLKYVDKENKEWEQMEGKFIPYAWGIYDTKLEKYEAYYGKNANKKFIDYLLNLNLDKKKKTKGYGTIKPIIVAYNGSRFDFHFILNNLLQRGEEVEILLQKSSGKLLKVEWSKGSVWDPCLFTSCDLKSACDAFGVSEEDSKKEFNHNKIKSWKDVAKYKNEVLPYLRNDVYALKSVCEKLNKALKELFVGEPDCEKYFTLSHMAGSSWQGQLGFNEIWNPLTTWEYDVYSKATYGGRSTPIVKCWQSKYYKKIMKEWKKVENITKEYNKQLKETLDKEKIKEIELKLENDQRFKKLKELRQEMINKKAYVFNADINSQYPSVMRGVENILETKYPEGKAYFIQEDAQLCENAYNNEPIGIYYIEWTAPNNIMLPVLPVKKVDGNYWKLGREVGWYTSVDIEDAKRHNYKIKFLGDGIYWKKTSTNIFNKYIDRCYNKKKEAKKEKNKVLYKVAKLGQNALYGRMLMRAITTKTATVSTINQFDEFINNHTDVKIKVLQETSKSIDKLYLLGTPLDVKTCYRKPRHLGVFILAYSRRLFLKFAEIISPDLKDVLTQYIDTDSMKLLAKDFEKLEKAGVVDNSKLGYMGNDCEDDAVIFWMKNLAPKNYDYMSIDKFGRVVTTMKTKGIGKNKLEHKWFLEEKKQEVEWMAFKKTSLNLTKKEKKENLSYFDIYLKLLQRTWNPVWKRGQLYKNIFFPIGFDETLKNRICASYNTF